MKLTIRLIHVIQFVTSHNEQKSTKQIESLSLKNIYLSHHYFETFAPANP